MNGYLRQSTASQARVIGPFVDDTDFKTAETGLTIANTDIKLRANGTTLSNKNSGGGTHQVNGNYSLTWDATDTANVGELEFSVVVAGALQVFGTYVVLEEAIYDALFASGAASLPATAAPGAAGGLFIAGSNAATTIAGLTTGAIAATTITASGAVAFQSTFAVTTSTSLAALSCTTLTASGAVALQSTLGVTGTTTLAGVTQVGTVSLGTVTTSGTVTFNAFTISNNLLISGTTTHTGATQFTGAVNAINASNDIRVNGVAAGGSGGLLISGSNSGTTTLGALTVTGATTLAALSLTTLTTSGAVSFGSTFTITTNLLVSGTTILTGAVTASNTSNNIVGIDVAKFSGDATAADNAELFFDGTGYAGGTIKLGVNLLTINSSAVTAGAGTRFSTFFDNSATASAVELFDIETIRDRLPGVLVGGRMDSSIGAVASTIEKYFGVVDLGTAQAATGTTLRLRSAAAFADDELIGARILITGGSTGVGQSREITDYVAATDTATVATWTTTPTGTITYVVFSAVSAAAGSGATAAQVWDYLTSAATTPGSMGAFLLTLTTSSGSGVNAVTITVKDQAAVAVQNVRVALVEGSNVFTGITNASGIASGFNLDSASYIPHLYKSGYTQDSSTALVVSASGNFNLTMTLVAITPPVDPAVCRLYMYIKTPALVASVGKTFTAKLTKTPAYAAGVLLASSLTSSASDSNGLTYLDVPLSASITPTDTQWIIAQADTGYYKTETAVGTTLNLGTFITT